MKLWSFTLEFAFSLWDILLYACPPPKVNFFSLMELKLRILLHYLCPLSTLKRRGWGEQEGVTRLSPDCSLIGDAGILSGRNRVECKEARLQQRADASQNPETVGLTSKLKFKLTSQTTLKLSLD